MARFPQPAKPTHRLAVTGCVGRAVLPIYFKSQTGQFFRRSLAKKLCRHSAAECEQPQQDRSPNLAATGKACGGRAASGYSITTKTLTPYFLPRNSCKRSRIPSKRSGPSEMQTSGFARDQKPAYWTLRLPYHDTTKLPVYHEKPAMTCNSKSQFLPGKTLFFSPR